MDEITTNTAPRIISLDIGNGNTKYMSSTEQGYFPSVYGLEEPGIDFKESAGVHDFVIERTDGTRYAIGWSASRLSETEARTMDRSRVSSIDYRILFEAALVAACGEGGLIAPILSLPVEWYEKRDEVKRFLVGDGDLRVLRIGERWRNFELRPELVRIVPEGYGTLCSLLFGGNENRAELKTLKVGVVDIGMKTNDLSLFDKLAFVPIKTRGFEHGLSLVFNTMQRLANREIEHNYTIEQLDQFLRGEESLYHADQCIDDLAQQWKEKALRQLANTIAGDIKTLWQGGNEVQRLLLTGGGAVHLYQYLAQEFGHVECVPNGPMANVIGAYLYAGMKAKAKV